MVFDIKNHGTRTVTILHEHGEIAEPELALAAVA